MSAWIEIKITGLPPKPILRRTLYECVNWNWFKSHLLTRSYRCRTLYECVNWNCPWTHESGVPSGRTLYECVNWNGLYMWEARSLLGRTLYECVNWNINIWQDNQAWPSRTLYECVNWNHNIIAPSVIYLMSHSIWVRELKSLMELLVSQKPLSHSIWVRELK